jgi:hypothetical protein
MMIGDSHFDGLIDNDSARIDRTKVDWEGIKALLQSKAVNPAEVVAISWCSIGLKNIEANIDAAALTIIYKGGILSSAGKRKMMSQIIKFDEIIFSMVQGYGDVNYADKTRQDGKYCIEFSGPGNVFLGRLQWQYYQKRFRDMREEMMALASERDRILNVVRELI